MKNNMDHTSAALGTKVKDIQQGSVALFLHVPFGHTDHPTKIPLPCL